MKELQRRRSNIFLTVLFLLGVYSFVSDDDYHKTFDLYAPVAYNCNMLNKNTPKYIIEECKKETNDSQTH
jgi:hypothetical protein